MPILGGSSRSSQGRTGPGARGELGVSGLRPWRRDLPDTPFPPESTSAQGALAAATPRAVCSAGGPDLEVLCSAPPPVLSPSPCPGLATQRVFRSHRRDKGGARIRC